MKKYYSLLVLFYFPFFLSAQWLTGLATSWNDSFIEWDVFLEDEEVEGKLEIRWKFQNDWTEWEYNIADERGTIKMTFQNNPGQWDIRSNGEIITAKTRWPNDPTEWRITNNSTTVYFKSRYKNNFTEWLLNSEGHGYFEMMTEWENDPREWRILDETSEDISLAMKMTMIFLAIYTNSPRQ